MDFNLTTEQQQIRDEIKKVCKEFPDAYWRESIARRNIRKHSCANSLSSAGSRR